MSGGDIEEQRVLAAIQRAHLLGLQSREDDALELLAEALTTSPDSPDLLASRAWLLNRMDRAHAALESAHAALRIDPDNKEALLQVSNAYLHHHDYARAEQTLVHMLESWPDDPQLHQQFALTMAIPYEDAAQKKAMSARERQRRRSLAYLHFEKALELAPEDPGVYETAARVVSVFSAKHEQALLYADQGLALAPEHLGLLQIRSVVLEEASAAANKRGSARASHAVAVVEADRILRLDPENELARQTLFRLFWGYRTLLIDVPLIGLALILFNVVVIFVSGQILLFLTGLILAALSTILRVVRYVQIASKVNRGFKRSVVYGTPHARLRITLSGISWTVMVLAGASLPFVRDAVLLRWIIVALGVAVIAALAASLFWYVSFIHAVQRTGGGTQRSSSLGDFSGYRAQSLLRTVLRGSLVLLAVLLLPTGTGIRADAVGMAYMAFAATLLPPLVSMVMVGLAERRQVEALPEDSAVRSTHRAPRVSRLAATGVAAVIVAAAGALNLVKLPVFPNEYDVIGHYRLPAGSGISDSECRDGQVTRDTCEGGDSEDVTPDPAIPTYEPLDLDDVDLDVFNVP